MLGFRLFLFALAIALCTTTPAQSARRLTQAEVGAFLQRGAELNTAFVRRKGRVLQRMPAGASGVTLAMQDPAGLTPGELTEVIFVQGQAYSEGDLVEITKVVLTRSAIEFWLGEGGYDWSVPGDGGARTIELSSVIASRERTRRGADQALTDARGVQPGEVHPWFRAVQDRIATEQKESLARNARHALAQGTGTRLRFMSPKGFTLEQLEIEQLEAAIRHWLVLDPR